MLKKKKKILMLSAGMITGAFRVMTDIIEKINRDEFETFVAYKPDYAEWGKDEIELIRQAGAKIISLRGRLLFDPRGFLDLLKALKKEKIDILHSWDVLGVPARLIGKLAGVKIVEAWGNPPPILFSEISLKHYLINKASSILVHGFIACSKGVMKRYQEERPVIFKKKQLCVVHNCVDVPHIDQSEESLSRMRNTYGIKHGESVLTHIGYFNEQKAQADLLYAFQKITARRRNVCLLLVGWGTLEKQLRLLANNLGIQDRVLFTGKLSRTQIFKILSITDVFVLSSHWEGFGIVLAEAMALGKPVVSTDTDGSREVVKDGKTGILVPIKNPAAMAEAILGLLESPELIAKMGAEGAKRVDMLFNCSKFIECYEDFYKTVLSD